MALCTPALIYFVLSSLGLLASFSVAGISITSVISNVFFMLIWVWLLNHLCSTGNETVAWILLLLPLIIFMLLLAFLAEIISSVGSAAAHKN